MNSKFYSLEDNKFDMNYGVFYPDEYKELPLLVYLHGAGERGEVFEHLYRHAIPKLINDGREIPAIVLCPQGPRWAVWDNVVDRVKGIIDAVAEEFGVKKDRICITGSSMGGYGTWSMGLAYPNFFSAIGPVAGGGMAWRVPRLKTTPVYAAHGGCDISVLPVYSELMVDKVNKSGGSAKYLVLEGYGHNDGINYAYRETDLIDWLLSQRRTDFDYVPDMCEEYF